MDLGKLFWSSADSVFLGEDLRSLDDVYDCEAVGRGGPGLYFRQKSSKVWADELRAFVASLDP